MNGRCTTIYPEATHSALDQLLHVVCCLFVCLFVFVGVCLFVCLFVVGVVAVVVVVVGRNKNSRPHVTCCNFATPRGQG